MVTGLLFRHDSHQMQITCMAYDVAEGSFLQARYLTKKLKGEKVKNITTSRSIIKTWRDNQ